MASITSLSTNALRPGTEFEVHGEGLDGDVLLTIPGAPVTSLLVLSRESAGGGGSPSTVITVRAKVPDDLSGLPSSNAAELFVAATEGNTNTAAVTFEAATLYFLCYHSDEQAGGLFGAKKDGIAGGGALSQYQELDGVDIRHKDGGQAFLQAPSATRDDLRQGYHIGTPAAQGTRVRVFFAVHAYRGFEPSPLPECSGWEVSDAPWLIVW